MPKNPSHTIDFGDPTEDFRRAEQARINTSPVEAEQQWTTAELQEEFEVTGFLAPYAIVKRKSDGQVGTVSFKHSPRIYFDFVPE